MSGHWPRTSSAAYKIVHIRSSSVAYESGPDEIGQLRALLRRILAAYAATPKPHVGVRIASVQKISYVDLVHHHRRILYPLIVSIIDRARGLRTCTEYVCLPHQWLRAHLTRACSFSAAPSASRLRAHSDCRIFHVKVLRGSKFYYKRSGTYINHGTHKWFVKFLRGAWLNRDPSARDGTVCRYYEKQDIPFLPFCGALFFVAQGDGGGCFQKSLFFRFHRALPWCVSHVWFCLLSAARARGGQLCGSTYLHTNIYQYYREQRARRCLATGPMVP